MSRAPKKSDDLLSMFERVRLELSDALFNIGKIESAIPKSVDPAPRFFAVNASDIRGIILKRRERGKFLPEGLFADPAWDMLLELYAAMLDNSRATVTSLCDAAAVPPTTALRWIGNLADAGMIKRQADHQDKRRVFIDLSSKGEKGMRGYFASNTGWI